MALTINCVRFMFYAKQLGASFQNTLMLGRLKLAASKEDVQKNISQFKNNTCEIGEVDFNDEYSEPLFTILGSETTDSIDYSAYEKATIIHDLNKPVPDSLKEKFTTIVDGGTVEHIFNFPQAIKNCMEMLKIGGHYTAITPVNNTMGHGFYQFSPELFFNIFRNENGFRIKKIIIYAQYPDGTCSDWYEVMDPQKVKSRVMLTNNTPTYMLVLAEKIHAAEIFATTPQQSDYEVLWNIKQSITENKKREEDSRIKFLYRKFMPRRLKIITHNIYDLFTKEKVVNEDLGKIDDKHFKKIIFEK